jgi:hypothetical protein
MNTIRTIGCAILVTVWGAISCAAPPSIVGTYSGTAKIKASAVGGKSTIKSAVELIIAADDTTTFTIDGVPQLLPLGDIAISNATDVTLAYADPALGTSSNLVFVNLNLKKTTLVGTSTGVIAAPGPPPILINTLEGKWKLKKQP